MDTSQFEALLDNAPLRPPNCTTSMLSYFRYNGAVVKAEGGGSAACPRHIDQGLLTIVASNKPGLEVRAAFVLDFESDLKSLLVFCTSSRG